MKTAMVVFDWVKAHNFQRLAERTVVDDSMPEPLRAAGIAESFTDHAVAI